MSIDDNLMRSPDTSLLDIAFGVGCRSLNIQGFKKTELMNRLDKIHRYAHPYDPALDEKEDEPEKEEIEK